MTETKVPTGRAFKGDFDGSSHTLACIVYLHTYKQTCKTDVYRRMLERGKRGREWERGRGRGGKEKKKERESAVRGQKKGSEKETRGGGEKVRNWERERRWKRGK